MALWMVKPAGLMVYGEPSNTLPCKSTLTKFEAVTSSNVKTKNDKEQKINIVTSAAPQSEPKSKGINKWVKLLLGLLIVVGLYAYLMSLMPNRINNLSDSPAATPSSSTPQTGVPLSADDFLNGM